MVLGNIKNIFNKQSFAVLVCLSAVIHIGIIASSSKIKDMIFPYGKKTVPVNSRDETTIEFVFNENSNNEKVLAKKKILEMIKEIEDEELEPEKRKRQQFIDSSQLQTDEEGQIEADKIGEKGSVARDKKTNDGDLNEESFSEGKSEIASIIKGSYSHESNSENVYVPGSLPENKQEEDEKEFKEDKNVVELEEIKEEIKKEEDIKPEDKIKEELNKEEETEISENTETNKENENRETEEYLTESEDELNQEIDGSDFEPKDKVVSVIRRQNEELRERESKFERIIPFPEEQRLLRNNQDHKDDETETTSDNVEKVKKRNHTLPRREKERIVREISEVYKKDTSHKQEEKIGLKPKVSMGVNGRTVYNAPAPSYKADLSNTSLLGEPSFNIRKHEYAVYYKHIREKISVYWLLHFGTDRSINLETKQDSPIIIEFKIRPSGRITDVQIAEDAGNPFLASRTRVSVINTQLDKFPDFIDEEFIDIRFNFFFF